MSQQGGNNMASQGRGYAPPLRNQQVPQHLPTMIPQYIASEQMQNTDSTGSQDSVMTQLPLPYHIGGENVYGQHPHTGYDFAALGQNASPFATPEVLSNPTFPEMRRPGSSGKLNPSSAPYYPGFPPSNNNYRQQQPAAYNTSFGSTATSNSGYQPPSQISSGSTTSSGYIGSQFSTQLGTVSSYSTPSPYGSGVPLSGPVGGSGGVQYRNDYSIPPNSNSYGHFGTGFDRSAEANRYNPPQPELYQAAASPAMGYNAVGNSGMTYQTVGYGGLAGNIHSSNNQMSPSVPGWVEQQNNQYAVQPPTSLYTNPSNANRGKPAQYNVNYNNTFFNKPTSNLATAPVVSANTSNQKIASNQPLPLGGPVRPLSKPTAPPSPSQSRNSVRTAASEHRSEVNFEVRSDTGTGTGSVTPAAKNLKHVEFQSEPRGTDTPINTLRSRRGQTISTDPKPNTVAWLEQVPSVLPARASPPKMSSLLAVGGINVNTLTTINEADPFVGPPLGASGPFTPGKNIFGPTTQLTPYTGGASASRQTGPSPAVRAITGNCTRKPTIAEALDTKNLPLVEYCRLATEDTFGVIKIKNIPYSVARPEILAFLGRNARIISESDYEPVHIVMERVTSKTLDCYVEFINFNEAVNAVNRFETNRSGGRGGRLGQRHVDVELSSQDQLMKDLFPKAKNVNWHGARPVIRERDPSDQYSSGFQGFISKEELVMLVKHVEAPQRSPFSKECPQRPFECLISTLLKYPWYMVDYITIEDRNLLHSATLQLIELLKQRIESDPQNTNINSMLFKRVWRAALKCPGFSPSQKDDIVYIVGLDFGTSIELGVPPFAADWKDLWTIGPKPGYPYDVVYYYAALIREETENKQQLSLAEKAAKGEDNSQPRLFGDLIKHIGLPWKREQLLHMTLAQVAAMEWAGIETVLKRALSNPRLE